MLFNQSFPISNTTPFISPNKKPLPSIVLSKKDANTYTSPRGNDASTNTETLGEKLGDRNLNFDDGVPMDFYCPISLDLLEDPVVTNTGITYSREVLMMVMREQIRQGKFDLDEVYRFDGSDPDRKPDSGKSVYIDSNSFSCPVTREPIHFITADKLIERLIDEWPKPCNKYIIPDDAFILYKNIKNNEIPDKLLKLYNKKSSNNTVKAKLSRLLSRKVAPMGGKKKKKGSTKRITVGLKNKKRKKRLKRTRKLVVNKI